MVERLSDANAAVHPWVNGLFTNAPASMEEVARRYGSLLGSVHQEWRGALEAAKTNKTALPASLPDAGAEQLRQVLYGVHAPVRVPAGSMVELDVHLYFDEKQQTLPLHRLLENQPLGTHIYVCGPSPMIDWVLKSAREAGWPDENVHSERFTTPPTGKPFTVELTQLNKTIEVGEFQSVLEAIEAAGVNPPYLCRGGACGQCESRVLSCDGTLEHNDHYLTDEEKQSGEKFMICVSRIKGQKLVLDL